MQGVPVVGKESLEAIKKSHLIQTEFMAGINLQVVQDAFHVP
jgi:hypothetical protein